MRRRTLRKALLVMPPALAVLLKPPASSLRLYVAGARYHKPLRDLRAGDWLELRRVTISGERAIAVFSGGRQLGFVPKTLLAQIGEHSTRAQLRCVSLNAVPWRWYRIEIQAG